MENYIVKRYEENAELEKAIKSLTNQVMVVENWLWNFSKNYLEKNYNDENLYIWYIEQEGKILATMMLKKLEDSVGRIDIKLKRKIKCI